MSTAQCIRCKKTFIFTSSPLCQSCAIDLSHKADNGTELEERVFGWQKKNIRR